ncbi:50S ribosomal protein L30 [Natronobacterium gregoryi]|uniref:Large ribosomal subunit protein uL30 n=2 Tax=Natronobacterium gregoryi TaxID=44930 RepID=L0AEJ0_NATGS|nr:50S ribosomal protein L30 [Natronobacterium gregoryi]AFZ71552.1 50S ribosomal protein L30P, archaeal [Natronobacterium gregoryi SP2]ELY66609.1 50S ribosomal protein L30P [Natronobacterium gregoryi SP2]PLK21321.1 50S ribosomal protein L30 [Natronobacterium gregoryi SP2]SFI82090.1 large subunit ribosomal protein L30 [Natronobacterium gregoryi]
MRAIVQVRGEVNRQEDVEDTLQMLNIHNVNHCALVPETDTYEGMIAKVNDYVAHGEPSVDVVATLLAKRAEPLEGDQSDADEEWLAENTEYDGFEELAEALVEEETTLRDEGLSPTLRLHPPRGGHDGIKKPTVEGGQLGKHTTDEINDLLESMR